MHAKHTQTSASLAQQANGVPLHSGVLAAVVACVVPLVQGINNGWSPTRIVVYALVALCFAAWVSMPGARLAWVCTIVATQWLFLIGGGLIGLVLQAISGDPFLQPIVFAVLFVHAALMYADKWPITIAFGVLYLGLIALGLVLSGLREPVALLSSIAGYLATFGFMYAFTGLSIRQALARQHADTLAADLARERDSLARLVAINAALARDLDISAVMQQVVAAGSALAQAKQARVWLRETESGLPPLRLAASFPAMSESANTAANEHALVQIEPVAGEQLVLPLLFGGEHIGALELRDRAAQRFSQEDITQLQPFATAAAIAIRNAQLFQQAQLSATLAERNRLARELHDTIAQGLTAITMQLEAAQRGFERDPERAKTRLERAAELSRATLDDVRRSVWTLASPLIDANDLTKQIGEQASAFRARTGIVTDYHYTGSAPRFDHAEASQLLRIVQEALRNVEKHAHAKHVAITSKADQDVFQLTVRDDGIGFDPDAPVHGGGGFGLPSLHERARLAGGVLRIESTAGKGTCLEVIVTSDRE